MGKFYDAIIGLVVGDALGVPFEFQKRDTFKAKGMTGFGTYNQPPGTWSDDSSMTLATVDSLAQCGGIDLRDMMLRFCFWCFCGFYTPHHEVFDVGRSTRNALEKYMREMVEPTECGGTAIMDNGNGSLMRILPLAFLTKKTVVEDINDVYTVSSLTHANEISQCACGIYVAIAKALISGKRKDRIVSLLKTQPFGEVFGRLPHLDRLSRDEIKSTGYVVDTLEAALWCLIHTDSYSECVLTAVNLGEDTDTVAAVAGGLAGIYYGVGGDNGIPEKWIDQIERKSWIKSLCNQFECKFQEAKGGGNDG